MQYEKKKQILVKLQRIYCFSFYSNIRLQEKESSITNLTSKIRQQQTKTKLKLFWVNFKKELVFLKKQTLFFENKPQFLLILRRKLWKSSRFCIPTSLKLRNTILSLYFMYGSKIKNHVKQLFPLNKKSSYWTKYMLKSFFLTQPVFQNPKVIKLLKTKNILLSKQGLNFFNFETQERTRFYYKTKFNSLVRSIWKRKLLSLTKTRIFTKKKNFLHDKVYA